MKSERIARNKEALRVARDRFAAEIDDARFTAQKLKEHAEYLRGVVAMRDDAMGDRLRREADRCEHIAGSLPAQVARWLRLETLSND